MEKSKKQIGSGLLLLSTMSFCLLPELLLAFVFQSAKHSLSESMPVLFKLIGAIVGAVLLCMSVHMIFYKRDKEQPGRKTFTAIANLLPVIFWYIVLAVLAEYGFPVSIAILGLVPGILLNAAVSVIVSIPLSLAFYGFVVRSMYNPIKKPVRHLFRHFGRGILVICVLTVGVNFQYLYEGLLEVLHLSDKVSIHFINYFVIAVVWAAFLWMAFCLIKKMTVKEMRTAQAEEQEVRVLRFSVILSLAGLILVIAFSVVIQLFENPVKNAQMGVVEHVLSAGSSLVTGDTQGALSEFKEAENTMELWLLAAGAERETSIEELVASAPFDDQLVYLQALLSEDTALLERYLLTKGFEPQLCLALLDVYEENGGLTEEQKEYQNEAVRVCLKSGEYTSDWIRPEELEDYRENLEAAFADMDYIPKMTKIFDQFVKINKAGDITGELIPEVFALAEEYPDEWITQYLAAYVGSEATSDGADHYDETITAAKNYVELYQEEMQVEGRSQHSLYLSAAQMMINCYGYESALPYLENVADTAEEDLADAAFTMAAECYEALEQYDKCFEACMEYLDKNPEHTSALYYAALSALKQEMTEEALEYTSHFAAYTEEYADREDFQSDLQLYSLLQYLTVEDSSRWTKYQHSVFKDLEEEQLDKMQENAFFYNYMRAVYDCFTSREEEHYELALEEIENVLKSNPNLPQAWYLKGVILYSMGERANFEEAVVSYKESLAINSENPTTWYALANAYDALEEYELAYEACEHSIALLPEDDHGEDWYGVSIHCRNLMNSLERELN